MEAIDVRRARLLGVRGDDFEVAARVEFAARRFGERDEGILCAAAGMDAAEHGGYTDVLEDEVDAVLQIVAAEKNVIKSGWH